MSVLPTCIYTTYLPGTQRVQKMVSDVLELKFQIVVSHHVNARNQIQTLHKSNKCSLTDETSFVLQKLNQKTKQNKISLDKEIWYSIAHI